MLFRSLNLTDFVVKPAQASYEAARAIGEPVRQAREEDPLEFILYATAYRRGNE